MTAQAEGQIGGARRGQAQIAAGEQSQAEPGDASPADVLIDLYRSAEELANPDLLSARAKELMARALEVRGIDYATLTIPEPIVLRSGMQYPDGYVPPGMQLLHLLRQGYSMRTQQSYSPATISSILHPDLLGQMAHKNMKTTHLLPLWNN